MHFFLGALRVNCIANEHVGSTSAIYIKYKVPIDCIFKFIMCSFEYEGCSNMNASGFITFFTYMLQQNGKHFYKGLYVTFKLAPDLKKYSVYLSRYSLLNKVHVSILTNPQLRIYTIDIDEHIIRR